MKKNFKFSICNIISIVLTSCSHQKLNLTVIDKETLFIKTESDYLKQKDFLYTYNSKGLVSTIKTISYDGNNKKTDSVESFTYKNGNLIKKTTRDNTKNFYLRNKYGNDYSLLRDGEVETFIYDSENKIIKNEYKCGIYSDFENYTYNSEGQLIIQSGQIIIKGDPSYLAKYEINISYINNRISKITRFNAQCGYENSIFSYDLLYPDGSKYDLVEITSNREKVVKEIPHSPKYGENGYIVKKYKNGSEDYYEYLEQYFINDYKNEEMVCWSTNETYDVSDGEKTLKTSIVEILTAGEDTETNEKWYEKVITTSEEGKDTTIENQKYVYSFKTI